jgi:hypothetical protein
VGVVGVDYAEGSKLIGPRRMAVYFAKYGTAGGKEYQHTSPIRVDHQLPGVKTAAGSTTRPAMDARTGAAPRLSSSTSAAPAASGVTAVCARCSPAARSPRLWGSPLLVHHRRFIVVNDGPAGASQLAVIPQM